MCQLRAEGGRPAKWGLLTVIYRRDGEEVVGGDEEERNERREEGEGKMEGKRGECRKKMMSKRKKERREERGIERGRDEGGRKRVGGNEVREEKMQSERKGRNGDGREVVGG